MRSVVLAALAASAGLAFAVPASAVTIVPAQCVSVTDAAGCFYNGNLGNQTDADAAESQYNALRDPDIELGNLITKSDASNFGDFGTITGGGGTSGTWSLPGYLISFLGVKAGNDFILYQLASPSSSGSWSTAGLVNRNGGQLGLSHLSFFGSETAVPEPAQWALMIGGFGLVGAAMRRRRAPVARTVLA